MKAQENAEDRVVHEFQAVFTPGTRVSYYRGRGWRHGVVVATDWCGPRARVCHTATGREYWVDIYYLTQQRSAVV